MIVYRLDEDLEHGDPADESNYTETKTSFLAFPDEDTAQECLTGYYENQDYSYRIYAEKLFEMSDTDAEELTKVLIEYNKKSTAGMIGPGDIHECPEAGCAGCPNNEPYSSHYSRCMLSRMIMPAGWHCYIVVEDGERKRCFAQVIGTLKCTDEWRG